MIEIPAAVIAMDAFVSRLDFLSIGTNDLIQYTLAVDRADEAVAHLYNPLHPAVVRLLAQAIGAANKAGKPIAVCGEMAGEVDLTRLLLGLGLRNFSMHPAHLLSVKQRVLTSEVAASKPIIDRIRRADSSDRIAHTGRQAQRVVIATLLRRNFGARGHLFCCDVASRTTSGIMPLS